MKGVPYQKFGKQPAKKKKNIALIIASSLVFDGLLYSAYMRLVHMQGNLDDCCTAVCDWLTLSSCCPDIVRD